MGLSTVIFTVAAAALALTFDSVYALWVLNIDINYVVILPQFVAVLYLDPNTYGALPAFAVGVLLRLGGGKGNHPGKIRHLSMKNGQRRSHFRTRRDIRERGSLWNRGV
ncbi:unnamed protein product [Clavelina lepadiformis]|uniref:Uncharacterized protein n=1 Tax=Clavelina lepadiformis TaxID=159417 RepID=A0ABP0G7B0_CLALP